MYLPRDIEKEIAKLWKEDQMIVIKGPRQAGKTTLLKHLQETYGGTYYTLEEDEVLRTFDNNPKLLVKDDIIYLDEVQLSPKAGKQLKFLYDTYKGKVKFVVSGSGAFDIKREVGAKLVGRAFFLTLLPLSFREFVRWKSRFSSRLLDHAYEQFLAYVHENKLPSLTDYPSLKELAYEYMVWGGYPAVVLSSDNKRKILESITLLTIERDIVQLFGLREIRRIKNFVKELAASVGQILKYSSFQLDYKTVQHYLGILEYGDLIALLQPYHRNEKTAIRKSPKLFFYDFGFRNAILGNFLPVEQRENKGALIEMFVFRELVESFDLAYWRTSHGAEVDLVIKEPLLGIEIKHKRARSLTSLKSFMSKYNARGLVMADHFQPSPILHWPFYQL
ncbi:MAG: ATP-binding protein [Candidatus Micrarchaeota archaeon]|nr:ATP-binding protein [Candidatus Micrarchaeota archaeon]